MSPSARSGNTFIGVAGIAARAWQAFVPQVHEAGVEGEVDWGEAQVGWLACARKVYLFHMRACHSGAAFAMAFPHCSQQAFLEAHVQAFDWFGGVFGLVRYDNLASAVKQVLRGRQRVQTDRFIALRSHYLYESQFTIPGVEGATKRAAWRARWGAFAAAISCPSRRSRRSRSSTHGCSPGARPISTPDRWAPADRR